MARNLPQTGQPNAPRITMHVDKRARSRFNAFNSIAKTIRLESEGTRQTCIRTGRHDLLLRQKDRSDNTPWSQVPPFRIETDIPPFEIGMYKELYSPEKHTETPEDIELMDQISQDLQEQNKRDRSDDSPQRDREFKQQRKHVLSTSDSDNQSDEDDPHNQHPKNFYLNSTPIPMDTGATTKGQQHPTTTTNPVPETPAQTKPQTKQREQVPETPDTKEPQVSKTNGRKHE